MKLHSLRMCPFTATRSLSKKKLNVIEFLKRGEGWSRSTGFRNAFLSCLIKFFSLNIHSLLEKKRIIEFKVRRNTGNRPQN